MMHRGRPIVMAIATPDTQNGKILPRLQKWQTEDRIASTYLEITATSDALKNLKWLDNLSSQIADSLTRPKSAYNYIIVEAARLGAYSSRGCVGNYMCDLVSRSCYRHFRYNIVLCGMI